MVERTVRNGRDRFHPRPVAAFVRLAQTFESDVQVLAPVRRERMSAWMDGKREGNAVEMDGKRYPTLSAIETLPPGAEVTIRAEGRDVVDAVEALTALLCHRISVRALSLQFQIPTFGTSPPTCRIGLRPFPRVQVPSA